MARSVYILPESTTDLTSRGSEIPVRKDYIVDTSNEGQDETAFVEQHWTEVWRREGGPQGAFDKIPRKPEFKLMRPYLEKMPRNACLLDGGCGLGDWTVYLTRNGHPTLGVDLSRSIVAKLKERFPDAEFAVGDVRATGLPDTSFDGYFSWGVFEHFEEGLQHCIREAYRLLKPGGYLFVTVPFDNRRHSMLANWDRYRQAKPIENPMRFYQWRLTRGELRRELAMGGFEVIDIRPIHKRQGVLRSLHHELGLPYHLFISRALSVILAPFFPASFIAHMVFGLARKPIDARP